MVAFLMDSIQKGFPFGSLFLWRTREQLRHDPRVAKLLKSFLGNRTKGYIFPNVSSKPIHPSNFLRREFHKLLKKAGIPNCGFHGFRRYRNTYLRNVAGCPEGLLKYWLTHSGRDMSDLYDKVREDPQFRKAQARKMGVGFKVPARLKAEETKQRKNVVRNVVRHPQPESREQQIPLQTLYECGAPKGTILELFSANSCQR
jgi:hypothetical protein